MARGACNRVTAGVRADEVTATRSVAADAYVNASGDGGGGDDGEGDDDGCCCVKWLKLSVSLTNLVSMLTQNSSE